MKLFEGIKGFLIDCDGVLWLEGQAISGVAAAIDWLRQKSFILRFITNTSMRNRAYILTKAARLGISMQPHELLTPSILATRYIQSKGYKQGLLMIHPSVREDVSDLVEAPTEAQAEYVLLGDREEGLSRNLLNHAFRVIQNQHELIAYHKNRSWLTPEGLSVDLGAYVAALEYATQTSATILGKPSPTFFSLALQDAGLSKNQAIMIGDDIESDIFGGLQAGIRTILVLSGKTDLASATQSSVQPDCIISSLSELESLYTSQL